jgi:hypothetical protein
LEYYDLEELEESEPEDLIDNGCDLIEGCTVETGLFGFCRMGENGERLYEHPYEICSHIDVLCSVIEPDTEHYLLLPTSVCPFGI